MILHQFQFVIKMAIRLGIGIGLGKVQLGSKLNQLPPGDYLVDDEGNFIMDDEDQNSLFVQNQE